MKFQQSLSSLFSASRTALGLSVICGLWVLLSQFPLMPGRNGATFLGADGVLSFLEEQAINLRFSARGSIPSPVDVVYVNVDFEALDTIGNFPWSREVFARALDALFEHGKIRAAGIDFVFSSSGLPQLGRAEAEAGSLALGKSVRKNQNIVLAAAFGSARQDSAHQGAFPFVFDGERGSGGLPELPEFPIVGPTWGHVGLINTLGEGARYVPFFAMADGHTYFPLSLELALIHWGLNESSIEIGQHEMIVRRADGGVAARIPLFLGQLVEPNWFSPWISEQNPQTSIVKVLAAAQMAANGTEEEKSQAAEFFAGFRDSIVLIGPTDPLLKDVSVLPLSGSGAVPRVSIHGNLLKTILSGRFLERPPVWANWMIIFGLGILSGSVCLVPQRFASVATVVPIVVMLAYVAAAFYVFSSWNLVIPMVAPLGAALSCMFAGTLVQLSREQRHKRRIRELFGSYVSSAVVDEMVEKNIPPKTGGAEVEITAFFSDIVSFSPIAEELTPTDLVELMSEYLGEGTSAVIDAAGTLDKYVGDAIVSIFGAPLPCAGHAAAACRAALALQEGQVRLRVRWASQADRWPTRVHQMSSRVGLHTGLAVVGNIGSKLRFNYTMMGDTVNLAARIEAAAGYYGAEILVSSETYAQAIRDDAELVFRPLDRVLVPGRSQPVELYELLGRGSDVAAAVAERLTAYAAAREIYRKGNWAEAREAFLKASEIEPGERKKNPGSAMAKRCQDLSARPPVADFVFALVK